MRPFGISEQSYDLIISAIRGIKEIDKVLIFGSRAIGNYKNGSDIDLALEGKGLNLDITWNLSALLNERLPIPYKVDILDINSIEKPELKEHIERVGKVFFDRYSR